MCRLLPECGLIDLLSTGVGGTWVSGFPKILVPPLSPGVVDQAGIRLQIISHNLSMSGTLFTWILITVWDISASYYSNTHNHTHTDTHTPTVTHSIVVSSSTPVTGMP